MRLRRLHLSSVAFLDLIKAHPPRVWQTVENALPDDVEIARVGYDDTGYLVLMLTSESFDEVPQGSAVPEHPTPVIRTGPVA